VYKASYIKNNTKASLKPEIPGRPPKSIYKMKGFDYMTVQDSGICRIFPLFVLRV
jgi:hypothetical protein